MQIEGDGIADIVHCLTEAKFHKDMIKTTDFNVRTEYENLKDGREITVVHSNTMW